MSDENVKDKETPVASATTDAPAANLAETRGEVGHNDSSTGELTDKTVSIRRVSKVVKGGRRFGFSALVVTGDGRGHVGVGLGKAAEVPDAIRKASEQARKTLFKICLKGSSIPHDVVGVFGPSKVVLKPAGPGTGVIAGASVRAIVEAAGIKDIRTKCLGSNNPHNVLSATLQGFRSLKDPSKVSALRKLELDEMLYQQY
jgi:small subunit ribosomal protein S5